MTPEPAALALPTVTDPAPPETAPRIAEGVTRDVLPNGLTLLVKENHNAPVVALLVTVQIGYFNEPDRLGGIAHVVEHMVFKGTERRPDDEQIAREVRELGGTLNASTYYEETNYYIIVPSDKLEQALEIQADMLRNSHFEAESLAKEIEVIVQESLQKRDSPTAMLVESLYELAYDQHRIRRWRIGHPNALRSLTRTDLTEFMAQTYRPENLIVTLVGDIDTAQAQRLVHRVWGDLERGEMVKETSPPESPRHDFRYRRLRGETRQRLLLFSFPAPPVLHPDAAALMVLSALLSDGRSARLFRKLKEELRLVSSAWASYDGFASLGMFTLGAECLESDPLPVEAALWAEIRRLQAEPVREADLHRVRQRVESRRLYAQEEVLGVARTLANYQALGDYQLSDALLARLRSVTPTDVQRVANTYLTLDGAALLEYLPQSEDGASLERTGDEITSVLRSGNAVKRTEAESFGAAGWQAATHAGTSAPSQPKETLKQEGRSEPKSIPLPGLGTLLFKRREDLPIISINVLARGGKRRETRANAGITSLMLRSSMKGTATRTAEEIASEIEGVGSGIGITLAADYLGYGMKITRDALLEGLPVFRDVLQNPTFPQEEVEREKAAMLADLRRQQDSSVSLAFDLFAEACFGESHPYGLPSIGLPEAIAVLTPADLAEWHARHFAPGSLVIAIVGDLSEAEAIALFETWSAGPVAIGNEIAPAAFDAEERAERKREATPDLPHPIADPVASMPPSERIIQRDKKQTATVLGFGGVTVYDADRPALDVLTEIVSGMGGRFFRVVRGENALAYSVSAFHRARQDAGNFLAYATTAPESADLARELLLAECARLGREQVTEEELRMAKATIIGEHTIGTQSFGAQSGELAGTGIFGLPLNEPQKYLAAIAAVTAEEVRAVAARYLDAGRVWTAIVRGAGPDAG